MSRLTLVVLNDRSQLEEVVADYECILRIQDDNELLNQMQGPDSHIKPYLIPSALSIRFPVIYAAATIQRDGNGALLTYLHAGQFDHVLLQSGISPHNRAIFTYLSSLPKETPVILYWDRDE